MSERRRRCAAILITDVESRILLVQQRYGMRFYGFPGGIVEPGETPEIAALRETQEEAGIEVEIEFLLGEYLLYGGGWPEIEASVFRGSITGGNPKPGDPEISDVLWRHLDDLPSPILPDAEAAIDDFSQNKREVVRTYQRRLAMPAWSGD